MGKDGRVTEYSSTACNLRPWEAEAAEESPENTEMQKGLSPKSPNKLWKNMYKNNQLKFKYNWFFLSNRIIIRS